MKRREKKSVTAAAGSCVALQVIFPCRPSWSSPSLVIDFSPLIFVLDARWGWACVRASPDLDHFKLYTLIVVVSHCSGSAGIILGWRKSPI